MPNDTIAKLIYYFFNVIILQLNKFNLLPKKLAMFHFSVVGSLTTVASGIATIVTAGAAIPFLVGSLMLTGFGVGALGAGLKFGGGIHGEMSKAALKKLEDAIKEDVEANCDLTDKLKRLQSRLPSSEEDLFKIKIISPAGPSGLNIYTQLAGISALISLTEKILRPLNKFYSVNPKINELLDSLITAVCGSLKFALTDISEVGVGKAAEIAAEAVKTMEEGFIKKQAYQAALKSAEESLKQGVKEGSNEAAKAAGKVATEAAKQSTDEVASVAARAAAANTVKNVARIAGGVTVGLGAVCVAWDVYNITKDSMKTSVGTALREIAEICENQLDNLDVAWCRG